MAVFLNEEEIGSDPALIGFPHLVLCGGVVVVMNTGTLVGAHVSNPRTETAVLYALRQRTLEVGGAMQRIYLVANLRIHLGGGMKDVTGKARAIGFAGPGYVVDLDVLNPTDGSYAQVASNGGMAEATVRVKLNQEMDYAHGVGPGIYKIGKAPLGSPVGSTRRNIRTASVIGATAQHNQDLLTPFVKEVMIV